MKIMYKDKSVSTFGSLKVKDFFEVPCPKDPFMKVEAYDDVNAVSLVTGRLYYFPNDEEVIMLNGTLTLEYT